MPTTPTKRSLRGLTDDDLSESLGTLADEIGAANAALDRLYEHRVKVYEEARRRGWTMAAIAATAQVSDVAVVKALRKAAG